MAATTASVAGSKSTLASAEREDAPPDRRKSHFDPVPKEKTFQAYPVHLSPSAMLKHSVNTIARKESVHSIRPSIHDLRVTLPKMADEPEFSKSVNRHYSDARPSTLSKSSFFARGSQMHRFHSLASQFGPEHHLHHYHHHHGGTHHHHHHHGHHHHHHHHGMRPVLEEIPTSPKIMIHETFEDYRMAKKRIQELQSMNDTNDQIILLFSASRDKMGRVWHNDCNMVERAILFLVKKIQAGGHLLKICVGDRKAWMDPENPWKSDRKFKILNLPTILVCDSMKRINGKKAFDMEALITLLKD